ncbi:hypothetical protein A3752_00775 [Oleiphilus sp. HI0081]|jgi:hypothetical protein|uniref:hypothetical protein n=1 Tax=unclassified Oleiphilus TaxID=2631174 RepID=UPI0007C23FAB|nr:MULTISPECIES: hypothetical protein [unclassified Oleiphilus]KZY28466.1 hypothetical protein A3729_23430 [Oleiphilus sp. HI0043]KZY43584.1 hypothetical protein A3732_14050 [Oleiphilus sp. HI0050]KZY79508.1 hypothetical protein A3740_07015 [Oleiphilus sp. HI0068]KZY86136.1 hypothetical protein A3743_17540 [Oleiphilus sp. HI0072]KZY87607.1 hypothetical protein A3741_13435 [Oleiphilus sp. HI0069]KZZ12327.1 hypothetical protein A3749_06700 [Oleiphilus sp. HI0078]KZZ22101.1 hypothetical protein
MLIHLFELLTLCLVFLAAYRGRYYYRVTALEGANHVHTTKSSLASELPAFVAHSPTEAVEPTEKPVDMSTDKPKVQKGDVLNNYIGDFF